MRPAALLVLLLAAPAAARPLDECFARLDDLGVRYTPARAHTGIEIPVEVEGPLGGVTYVHVGRPKPLILDCSLVYSLALAGRYFVEEGMTVAYYTDAYDRRFVHGTTRWSKHAFGLALDIHYWRERAGGAAPGGASRLSVRDDFEKGLGRGRDCIGHPDDTRARALRLLWCRLERSELFKLVLDPDYDRAHRDHFHVQARAWERRTDLDWRR